MKKYIFMAVAGLLALSSCSNDDNDELIVNNTPRQMTFTAGYSSDAAQTRATLDGTKVKFDGGDAISILSTHTGNAEFTTSLGANIDAYAQFTGMAVYGDENYYAVYPYTSGLSLSDATINGIVIPANQWNANWASGNSGWDKDAPVAWAKAESNKLDLHNLCAILKITISGGWYGKVTISANEPLAGTFNLDTSSSTLTGGASSTVTVGDDDTNKVYANGNTLYIAIAPGEYNNFTVRADQTTDGSAHQEKTKTKFTFVKGKIYDLGTFNVLATE